MKVLVTDGLDAAALATLRKAHQVDVQELDAKSLLTAIASYEGIIVRSRTKVTKEVFSRATRLKVVGRSGVGVDNIDVEEATARKIVVVNAPTASTVSVAELAIGHMVSLLRHLPEANLSVRSGKGRCARGPQEEREEETEEDEQDSEEGQGPRTHDRGDDHDQVEARLSPRDGNGQAEESE